MFKKNHILILNALEIMLKTRDMVSCKYSIIQ